MPQIGDVLAGKYAVESLLGEGGMCTVYRARRLHLEDYVAIKVLRPEMAKEKILVERFMREGRAVACIRSEHAVRVIDIERMPCGTPYMVLEYLDGTDLDEHLADDGPLPVATAVDYVLQACEAIVEAHDAGIVHRDLKPANLFLTRFSDGSPWIKVLDFGISKVVPRPDSLHDVGITMDASVLGSPRYMSPEQIRAARDMDHRVDIWALGVILYELIADRTPFLSESLPELCTEILRDEPPALGRLRGDCPAGLSKVVARCLAKEPSGRFASVRELARALAEFASPLGQVSANRILGHRKDTPSVSGVVLVPAGLAPASRRDRLKLFAGIATAALLVAGFAVQLASSSGTKADLRSGRAANEVPEREVSLPAVHWEEPEPIVAPPAAPVERKPAPTNATGPAQRRGAAARATKAEPTKLERARPAPVAEAKPEPSASKPAPDAKPANTLGGLEDFGPRK